jgi:hypothetical protein
MHYGSTLLPARFWRQVFVEPNPCVLRPELGSCWIWTGYTRRGHGAFWLNGKNHGAHRLAFTVLVRDPSPLHIDHLYRVRRCVNPTHLEPVTLVENIRRGVVGEHQRSKTHCPFGHPYDTDNTLVTRKGHRRCRECNRIRCKERWNDNLEANRAEQRERFRTESSARRERRLRKSRERYAATIADETPEERKARRALSLSYYYVDVVASRAARREKYRLRKIRSH